MSYTDQIAEIDAALTAALETGDTRTAEKRGVELYGQLAKLRDHLDEMTEEDRSAFRDLARRLLKDVFKVEDETE